MQPTFVRRQPSEPRCATNPLRPRVQPPLIRPLPCQNNGCSSGVSARLNLISRGDVVVLRSPDDDALITKRVVAMGGETVRHREHGSRLVRVPTAHLWVEGDNGEVGLAVKKSGPSLGFSWSSALDPILGPSCGVAGALGPVLGAPGRVCPGNNDGSAAAIAVAWPRGALYGARTAQSTPCLHHQVSTDSNHFGSVGVESVQARVAAKLWPLNEAGFVR